MVSKFYLFVCGVFMLLASCGKNEFTLRIDLASDVSGNYNVTYYATAKTGGVTVQAVAPVMNGKYLFTGTTKLPTLVFVSTRATIYPLVIYTTKGENLEITGENKDPLTWNVEGDKINRSLNEWRKENLEALIENQTTKVNEAVGAFIERNATDPAAVILLSVYYDREADERGYSRLLATVKRIPENRDLLRITGSVSQTARDELPPARLFSLIMRSMNEGADTLRISRENPSILWFWKEGVDQRADMVDSLKALVKEFPDSSARLIADINLDIDSMAWRRVIKRDSLEKTARLWAPAAQVDPQISLLKVKELPYFIVFDKDGYQSYRGNDISAALKEFRDQYYGSDSIN